MVKNPPIKAGHARNSGFIPGFGTSLKIEKWQPTTVFLPRESHGQRQLVSYSPGDHKELDMTEHTHTHKHTHAHT